MSEVEWVSLNGELIQGYSKPEGVVSAVQSNIVSKLIQHIKLGGSLAILLRAR